MSKCHHLNNEIQNVVKISSTVKNSIGFHLAQQIIKIIDQGFLCKYLSVIIPRNHSDVSTDV